MKNVQIFENFSKFENYSKREEILKKLDGLVNKKLISTLEDYALEAIDNEYRIKIAAFTGGNNGYNYLLYDVDMDVMGTRLNDEQIDLVDIKNIDNAAKNYGIMYCLEIYTFQEDKEASTVVNSVMNRMIKHYKTIKIIKAQCDNIKYGANGEGRYKTFNLNDDVVTSNITCYFTV